MDRNCIITAPQVASAQTFFEIWKTDHVGSLEDFYMFMTTPSPERDSFMDSLPEECVAISFSGSVAQITLINQE